MQPKVENLLFDEELLQKMERIHRWENECEIELQKCEFWSEPVRKIIFNFSDRMKRW
jgi:hypothetical protein